MATTQFVPVYDKDGNEIIILHPHFVANNEQDAHDIALGSMLVECILLGMKFVRIQEIDTMRLPHMRGTLQGYNVAIIAGPDGPDPEKAAEALAAAGASNG